MASPAVSRASLSHVERTSNEPRDKGLYRMILYKAKHINNTIIIYKFRPIEGETRFTVRGASDGTFYPGQWLDVHIPGIPRAGGFTITSSPSSLSRPFPLIPTPSGQPQASTSPELDKLLDPELDAESSELLSQMRQYNRPRPKYPFIELAIQKSPDNPAAAWFWKETAQAKDGNLEISVRVGGSFIWPPSFTSIPRDKIKRVVFIGGGVGVNPLMSMLRTIFESRTAGGSLDFDVVFLYSAKHSALYAYPGIVPISQGEGERYLFLNRIAVIVKDLGSLDDLKLFLTPPAVPPMSRKKAMALGLQSSVVMGRRGTEDRSEVEELEDSMVLQTRGGSVPYQARRIELRDLEVSLGKIEDRDGTVVYVCGPPSMTDSIFEHTSQAKGMSRDRVFCEKWW